MKCPNCNSVVTKNVCRKCGLDLDLYDKSAKVSLALYNKGLEAANRNQLSDAIYTLVKSIEFDKRNISARNLLGLCYFACGKINEALKEWVISTSYEKNDNLADYYLDIFQKNSRQIQRYDDSAHMYNQAIIALHQKSDDIAIIQLKKAVEYNPNFVDALNLLCLCYLGLKDKSRAGGCVDKVLEIDTNNKTALAYFRELYPSRNASNLRTRIDYTSKSDSAAKPNAATILSKKAGSIIGRQAIPDLPVSQFISFAVGAVCMFAVIYILIIPAMKNTYKEETEALNSDKERIVASYESSLKQKDEKIENLQKEIEAQNDLNKELTNELDVQARVQKINIANGYLSQDKPEDAINYLQTIETSGLPPETIELYNYIKDTALPIIEADYYAQGISAYNAKNYDDTVIFFEKSISYSSVNSTTIGNSYYYLGRVAEISGDDDAAEKYYETVINDYPTTSLYNYAVRQLNNLR